MKLSKIENTHLERRVKAVETYLNSESLKETALSFNIHPRTLKRWITKYQNIGIEGLKRKKVYYRHSKRFAPYIEKEIALLKESEPTLTLGQAQNILKTKKDIKISIEGIRAIWQRYNFINLKRNGLTKKITYFELEDAIKKAELLLNKGNIKESAKILNSLPSCTGQEILKRIPDGLLSLKRQVEKLPLTFGEIPFAETRIRARRLRQRAEKKGLLYTAVQAGIGELFASGWRVSPDKQLALVHHLRYMLKKKDGRDNSDPIMRFNLLYIEAMALADMEKYKEALSCIRKCKIIGRYFPYPNFYHKIASLYSIIGDHKKENIWLEKGLNYAQRDEDKQFFYIFMSANLARGGQYKLAKEFLKKITLKRQENRIFTALVQAQCALGESRIQDAEEFANESLSEAKREKISVYLLNSSIVHAGCLCALGEKKKAKALLKMVLSVMGKYKMKRSISFLRILLGEDPLSLDTTTCHTIRLVLLLSQASKSLKTSEYRKAFKFAESQQLMGSLHRFILFFPASANRLIIEGKPTALPKVILRLPVFNKETAVYNVKFLGGLVIYKNQKYLRVKLPPKDTAFLIHLVLKTRESYQAIPLKNLYQNFWPNSQSPARNLSHLCVRVRKALKIPAHLLEISWKENYPVLINRGIYFTTDYNDFEIAIAQAKALERAGEWGFAKKEYLRAFKLFRGEPLKKNFDDWSLNMRHKILTQLETEALNFAKSCLERDNEIRHKKRRTPKGMADARKVLQKVLKIIPNSEEIQNLVNYLGI